VEGWGGGGGVGRLELDLSMVELGFRAAGEPLCLLEGVLVSFVRDRHNKHWCELSSAPTCSP
jgi:hypothetical protein